MQPAPVIFSEDQASAFDSITLDGSVVPPSSEDAKADRDMIAKPTVDDVLKNKLPG